MLGEQAQCQVLTEHKNQNGRTNCLASAKLAVRWGPLLHEMSSDKLRIFAGISIAEGCKEFVSKKIKQEPKNGKKFIEF
jgi:hypothetical protein